MFSLLEEVFANPQIYRNLRKNAIGDYRTYTLQNKEKF